MTLEGGKSWQHLKYDLNKESNPAHGIGKSNPQILVHEEGKGYEA